MSATAESRNEVLEVGPLEILPEEHLARADGRALMLSIRELRLLTELARRADRIMAREELFSLVWGREMRPGRPVGRRVRAEAAREARRRRCRGGGSSTRISASATGWRPSTHSKATIGSQLINT